MSDQHESMGDPKWPSWRYGPNNASMICNSEKEVPAGWVDHPSKLAAPKKAAASPAENLVPATKPKKAEATAEKSPLALARIAYKEKFGKTASPRMTLEAINEKLAEGATQHDL